eukprot:TRINITY_DN32962_c0_g1_i1.p2 TRINITY_DN32962_c0_g1~~TRINITY_DN32962_c0_g1_i1.p2  ORF type:complete len:326 (+),score=108.13 TRINITY_DN32962_c0_g1_i1:64-978(+)
MPPQCFALCVGCDLFGRKYNARLRFAARPGLAELINAAEGAYDTVARACRASGYPDVPFKAEALQVYDDTLMRWVDLVSAAQLRSGGQLFCHQPDSPWHSDAQGVLPRPFDTAAWLTVAPASGGARRPWLRRAEPSCGQPPSKRSRALSVFRAADQAGRGALSYSDLRGVVLRGGIELLAEGLPELFHAADRDRDRRLSMEEWTAFAAEHFLLVDALFFRLGDAAAAESDWLQHVAAVSGAAQAWELERAAEDSGAAPKGARELALARRVAREAQSSRDAEERARSARVAALAQLCTRRPCADP